MTLDEVRDEWEHGTTLVTWQVNEAETYAFSVIQFDNCQTEFDNTYRLMYYFKIGANWMASVDLEIDVSVPTHDLISKLIDRAFEITVNSERANIR